MPTASQTGTSDTEQIPAQPMRSIAYLVSRYPTLSMIFVLREVLALRELGFRIETASINPPDRPPEKLTTDERSEAARTYCVKCHGVRGALAAHCKTLLQNFAGYARGLAQAFRLAGLNFPRLYLNLMYFTEALMVGQWMRRNRQTHLHVHLASQAASVGLFVHRVFRFRYSLTVHGPDEFYDAQGHYLAEKIEAADLIVCISSYTRSQLMNLSPYRHWKKFVVVRLGVDTSLFSPAQRPAQLPARQNASTEAFEILCVGRLTPAKGQHLLIDAVDRLAKAGHRVRLRLVGNGPDEVSLRNCAGRLTSPVTIVFEGAVNQDRIRGFYQTADLFCLPSFAEGLPVVLMEAMAMELPCVSTHITGIPELIRNEVDGLLIPASDLDALTEALAHLMADPALRARLASSGRARILEHYNLASNVEKLSRVFIEKLN
jgi:glycosyltransferase involved in cell wall biosynthesis